MPQHNLPFAAAPAISMRVRSLAATVRRTTAGGVPAIEARLARIDREWDIERVRVEARGATAALTGLVLGFTNERWLPRRFVNAWLERQRGWAPPLVLIRAFGVRSASEIDRERAALVRARDQRLALEAPRASSFKRTVWTPLAFDAAE